MICIFGKLDFKQIKRKLFNKENLFNFLKGRKYTEKVLEIWLDNDVGKRLFWNIEEGKHKIIVVDTYGRSSFVDFRVR